MLHSSDCQTLRTVLTTLRDSSYTVGIDEGKLHVVGILGSDNLIEVGKIELIFIGRMNMTHGSFITTELLEEIAVENFLLLGTKHKLGFLVKEFCRSVGVGLFVYLAILVCDTGN